MNAYSKIPTPLLRAAAFLRGASKANPHQLTCTQSRNLSALGGMLCGLVLAMLPISSAWAQTQFGDMKQFMQNLPQKDNPNTPNVNELEQSKKAVIERVNSVTRSGIRISVNSDKQYINPVLTQTAIDRAVDRGLKTYLSPAGAGSTMKKSEWDKFKSKCNFISPRNENGGSGLPTDWTKGTAKTVGPDIKLLKDTLAKGSNLDFDIISSHNLKDAQGNIGTAEDWKKLIERFPNKQVWDSECFNADRIQAAKDGGVNLIVFYQD